MTTTKAKTATPPRPAPTARPKINIVKIVKSPTTQKTIEAMADLLRILGL